MLSSVWRHLRRSATWPARLEAVLVPGVRGKLVFLSVAAVSVTALCSALFIVQARATLQRQVFGDQTALGRTYARVVQEYLNGSRDLVQGLAQIDAVRAPLDMAAVRPELSGVPVDADAVRRATIRDVLAGSGRLQSLVMLAPNGDLYLVEPSSLQQDFQPNLAPIVQQVLAAGTSSTWSDIVPEVNSSLPTVVVEVPVKDDSGQLRAVLAASLGVEGLADAARAVQRGDTTLSVMLFDRRGIPIVYPDTQRIVARAPLTQIPVVEDAVAGRVGSSAYHNPLTGRDELGTAVALDNGWFAVITESQAAAFEGLNSISRTVILVLGVSGVVLVLAGWWQTRAITHALSSVAAAAGGLAVGDLEQDVPLNSNDELGRMAAAVRDAIAYQQSMASVAAAIASGDLSRDVHPKSERDVLGIAFERMSHNLRTLIGQLEEQAITLRRQAELLELATDAVIVRDPYSARILFWNRAAERLYGWDRNEVLGHPQHDVLQTTFPRPRAEIEQETLATGRWEGEVVHTRRDGTRITVWSRQAVQYDPPGRPRAVLAINTDVTERRQAAETMRLLLEREREAHTAAEQALLLRDRVLHSVSHDLMNPLSAIIAGAQLLERRLGREPLCDRAIYAHAIADIVAAARGATSDVAELVDVARLQVGHRLELHRAPMDLVSLARRTVAAQQTLTESPIHFEAEEDELVGCWDEQRLSRVLGNLISNAVKYSSRGEPVTVSVRREHDSALLAVRDNGIGIPAADLPHVFDWFHRAGNVGSIRGTGIGLASSYQVVREHGGDLQVASQEGVGSTFTVRLPL